MTDVKNKTITTYKGFNKSLKCRDFQFELGATYTQEGSVEACRNGFHACEHPLDVFSYYAPSSSRFAVVEQSGDIAKHKGDSKVASATITITAEITIHEMIERAVKYVFDRAKPVKGSRTKAKGGAASATGSRGAASATGYYGAASATGDYGAASATGYYGAASATGSRGAASATGDCGAASATGSRGAASATGSKSSAMASGYKSKAKAAKGCAFFLCERDDDYCIIAACAAIAGKKGIKPDTWYTVKNGKMVECES